MSEQLTLKWGTLKGWKLNKEGPAMAALRRYHELGDVSVSVMMQRDTPEQKQVLYDLIDALDSADVYLDWEDKRVSKEEAKAYLMNYGTAQESTA